MEPTRLEYGHLLFLFWKTVSQTISGMPEAPLLLRI